MKKITNIKKLELLSNQIRQDIIRNLLAAGSGHSAGPLGMADIFTVLYFNVMNHNPKKPNWDGRDRLILSNGHICPILYATMARAGYFSVKYGLTLRKFKSKLQGHPHRVFLKGLESSSGPLGSGLSQAAGMAYALNMDKKKSKVFCMMSDGELDAGNTWEGAMFAGKNKLRNLVAIIDRNNIQINGYTEDVMPVEPLRKKFESFNWHVLEVDGHNHKHVIDAIKEAHAIYEKPTVIIAHTIPGKGVGFMEFEFSWHGKPPKKDEAALALKDLRTLRGQIISEHE